MPVGIYKKKETVESGVLTGFRIRVAEILDV